MNKFMSIPKKSVRAIVVVCFSLLLFSACKKESFNNDQQSVPAAGIMAFNLSPDQAPVGFDVASSRVYNIPLTYTDYTGNYLPVYTGSKEIRFFNYLTGSTVAFSSINFADSGYYSTFLLGANENYRNVIVEDKLVPLTATTGKAWVRYINAIPDSSGRPLINIGSAGNTVISDSADYARVSDFVQVNAGQVTASVNNGSTINASRTIILDENRAYTVLFVGLPSATDSSHAVQVRYIQNAVIALN